MGLLEENHQTCRCLDQNVIVESLVIVLTVVAGIAITCWNLIAFDIFIVPEDVGLEDRNVSCNTSFPNETETNQDYKEVDQDIQDLLQNVMQYVNIGIAALFLIEIFFKIVTLRKQFFTKPSQLVDGVIVILCAAVQSVFYFISLSDIYYCCSFLVVARLWRICSICAIREKRMKIAMEKDIEHRITDHLGTRQRCIILENISMQQENQIKALQEENMRLSQFHRNTGGSMTALPMSDMHLSSEDIQNNNMQAIPTQLNHIGGEFPNGLYAKANLKPRWRRSSTNEYLERRLSSHTELDSYSQSSFGRKKPSSMSNVMLSNENQKELNYLTPSVDYHNDSLDEIDGKPDNASIKSSDGSEPSSNKEESHRKCNFRRQNSCPEFMFAQRMKFTKYESMLIENQDVNDYGHDNGGFSPEDGIPMSILAVHDETRTYRSQNGIPTTDL